MKTFNSRESGFSLIELITVMAIIAILAGVSIFALAGSRETARDARRKADMQGIASALELFKADCNYYPNALPSAGSALTGGAAPCSLSSNTYKEVIPDDPLTADQDYAYVPLPSGCDSTNNCTRYKIWATLEDPGTVPAGCPLPAPSCGTPDCNYCVLNP